MSRGDQLGRQWSIVQTIVASNKGRSVAELSDELDCNPRTIYRDLVALQVAGFPMYTERVDGRNLWSIMDVFKHQIPIPFSLTELMALYFSRDMVKVLQDTVFHDSLESLFKKIQTTLPTESKKFLKSVQKILFVSQNHYKQYSKFKEIINTINEAAVNRRTVRLSYFAMSSRQKTTRIPQQRVPLLPK